MDVLKKVICYDMIRVMKCSLGRWNGRIDLVPLVRSFVYLFGIYPRHFFKDVVTLHYSSI